MKALSIRQPWAWLIVNGFKNIENREWGTNFRGRIYVHTGMNWDANAMDFIRPLVKPSVSAKICMPQELTRGAIIGEVDIKKVFRRGPPDDDYGSGKQSMGDIQEELEYLRKHQPEYFSPWFIGKYGFLLANPVAYEKPIPYKGSLRLFEVKLALVV